MMDKIQKKRIAFISSGIAMVAVGISFITLFPEYSQYSDIFILGGAIQVIVGYKYPLPEFITRKPKKKITSTDGGKVLVSGCVMFFTGLGLGVLALFTRDALLLLSVAALLFVGGFIIFMMGFAMFFLERSKESN